MIKTISLLVLFGILMLGSIGNPSLNLSLSEDSSNIYPDSFAIHWTPMKPLEHLKNKKNRIDVKVKISDLYDDVHHQVISSDTIIKFPSLNGDRFLLNVCLANDNNHCSYEHALMKIKADPEIELLRDNVINTPSIENYRLLAETYEKNRCYVNALFILNRISRIDQKIGEKLWNEYAKRHWQDFKGVRVKR